MVDKRRESSTKPFQIKSIQEGMPKSGNPVLIYVEGDWRYSDAGWTVGYYNGSRWIYEVPAQVFNSVAEFTGHRIPEGEDVIEPSFDAQVTYWADLPATPVDASVKFLSDVETVPVPEVKYDSEADTLEIYGEPSPYTEVNPYILERKDFHSVNKALLTMAHVGAKTWARSDQFLRKLALAMADLLEDKTLTVN